MQIQLTSQQQEHQAAFRSFAREVIAPHADAIDQQERLPAEILQQIARQGYLGAIVPHEYGGMGLDMISFGLLNEELGWACSSVRSLLTVHSMVQYALLRWGKPAQKEQWLPRLASGETIGAFALTEPNVGSDAKSIETIAARHDETYRLNGEKKWITFGQIADLLLVFAQYDGKPTAFLVERTSPGFATTPISGMLGTRGSMLAEVHLRDCEIPKINLLGGIGFGMAGVAMNALDLGRYSVACGSVGIAQACLDASLAYTSARKQFGVYLKDHQLIRQMITDMLTNIQAARLLCYQAGYSKDMGDPNTVMHTLMAKYFASSIAMKAAADAVQMHGANGCSPDYPVQRFMRDAKVMEIIEGSTQIQQITIAKYAYQG